MALGGGLWTTQNKVLPGSYINFVSAAKATAALSDRGVAAMPVELDWGPEGAVFTATNGEFMKDSHKLFGYAYTEDKLKGLRDLYRNATTGVFYRLGVGTKAENDLAAARYGGTRGNDLKIAIAANVDDSTKFDVSTVLGSTVVDVQTVAAASDLKENDFVVWKAGATLAVTAGTALSGGANAEVDGADYQAALDAFEGASFHILGCTVADKATKALVTAWTKRMRDEVGAKFQTVLYQPEGADYEGVIGVQNKTADAGWPESSAVYWVTGAQAGCAANATCTNKKYDGEFVIETPYTQDQLAQSIKGGMLALHKVGDEVRVLSDINTLVTLTEQKNADFCSNQTMRVLDQIANDVAALFNTRFLGAYPNDAAGRNSLWSAIIDIFGALQKRRAIQNFVSEDAVVAPGSEKGSVLFTGGVQPVNAMDKLYMTVKVQ